jgi:hypothetical protein
MSYTAAFFWSALATAPTSASAGAKEASNSTETCLALPFAFFFVVSNHKSRRYIFFKWYEYFSPGHFKGTIILPYVLKIWRAYGAQFQTYGILLRVDPPHYWFLLHF